MSNPYKKTYKPRSTRRGSPGNVREYLPTRRTSAKRSSPRRRSPKKMSPVSSYHQSYGTRVSPGKMAALERARSLKRRRRSASKPRVMRKPGVKTATRRLSSRKRSGVRRSKVESAQFKKAYSSARRRFSPSKSYDEQEYIMEDILPRRKSSYLKVKSAPQGRRRKSSRSRR